MALHTCVREARLPDAGSIAQIHVAAWKLAYRGLLPDSTLARLTVEAAEKQWQERLSDPALECLVVTDGEQVVGYAGYGPARDEDMDPEKVGEIYMLYVAPEEWRKGYGTALAREAVARLEEKGASEIILWVLHNNEQAIAFYKAAGFVADGVRQVKHRRDGTEMIVARYRHAVRPVTRDGRDIVHS